MKSLEHLIREIQEGKTEKAEKKSLGSSIRKVMSGESSYAAKDSKPVDEHCGCEEEKKKKVSKEDGDKLPGAEDKMDEAIGIVGGEYKGNQFASIRTQTPHIKPPDGAGSHSQAPENASRQRTLAKEKGSMTLHGKVSESKVKELEKGAELAWDIVKPYVSGKTELVPYGKKNLPALLKKSKDLVSKAPETPPLETPPKAEISTKVETPPKLETPAKLETPPKYQTPPKVPTEIKTPGKAPENLPVKTPQTSELPKSASRAPVKTPPVPPSKNSGRGKFKLPKFGGVSVSGPEYVGKPWIEAPWKVHDTKAHKHFRESAENGTEERKKIFDMPIGGERKKTSYVGRPDDDVKGTSEKLSRQAQYKIKVIDEGKKLASIVKKTAKEYESGGQTKVFDRGEDVIVVNPNTKKIDLSVKEGVLDKAWKGLMGYDVGSKAIEGKPAQAATSALSMLSGPVGLASTASELMGMASQTEKGKKQGQWIAKNVPGALSAADAMRKAGEWLGVRDKPEAPSDIQRPSNAPPPLETKPEEKKKKEVTVSDLSNLGINPYQRLK